MLKHLFTKSKDSRLQNRNRQRQRMSRKMIIILGLSVACLVVALIVVITVSHIDESKAALTGATSKNIVIVPDEVYETSVTVNEPAAARTMPVAANTQLGHIAKPLSSTN